MDAKSPWSTQRISPKPLVNAMATRAGVLEGTVPVRRVKGLGDNVWAYLFDHEGVGTLAIWSAARPTRVSLPVGSQHTVEHVDIMGRRTTPAVHEGKVELTLDGSPQYVVWKR